VMYTAGGTMSGWIVGSTRRVSSRTAGQTSAGTLLLPYSATFTVDFRESPALIQYLNTRVTSYSSPWVPDETGH